MLAASNASRQRFEFAVSFGAECRRLRNADRLLDEVVLELDEGDEVLVQHATDNTGMAQL